MTSSAPATAGRARRSGGTATSTSSTRSTSRSPIWGGRPRRNSRRPCWVTSSAKHSWSGRTRSESSSLGLEERPDVPAELLAPLVSGQRAPDVAQIRLRLACAFRVVARLAHAHPLVATLQAGAVDLDVALERVVGVVPAPERRQPVRGAQVRLAVVEVRLAVGDLYQRFDGAFVLAGQQVRDARQVQELDRIRIARNRLFQQRQRAPRPML